MRALKLEDLIEFTNYNLAGTVIINDVEIFKGEEYF